MIELKSRLRILIDDKLTWKNHISLTKSKLSKCCAIMYRDCTTSDRCGLSVLSLTLVDLYYVLCCATDIECLVLLQKNVVMLLCGAKRLHHTCRLIDDLRILKVPDFVELRIGIIMFKAYHNLFIN